MLPKSPAAVVGDVNPHQYRNPAVQVTDMQ